MGDDLIRQLKEAGHEEAANSVRDRELAKQLEAAGHTGLAAQLTGERAPEAPKDPVQAEAEEFLAVLKDKNASAWTSAGGLLDR